MAKRMLFIFNPHTGGGRLRPRILEILCIFGEAGFDVTVHPTRREGDARDTVRRLGAKSGIVVCCGGDGTLNEVVDGLRSLPDPPPLGYIPGGTTNDFATSLKIPKDMLDAARRIVTPRQVFAFDYATFNDRVINYVAAFGAFTDVSYSTPQNFKNVFGYLAYVVNALGQLANLPHFSASIRCDDDTIEGDFLLGMVTNSTSVGGLNLIKKDKVAMNDGLFEVMLVHRPTTLTDLHQLSQALMTKGSKTYPGLVLRSCRNVQVASQEAIPWTLDGEFGGDQTCAEVQVQQQKLRICR